MNIIGATKVIKSIQGFTQSEALNRYTRGKSEAKTSIKITKEKTRK